MTKIELEQIKCYVCRKTSEHSILVSISYYRLPDLDTRPRTIENSSYLNLWIQECPFCGYCFSNISQRTRRAKRVVRSKKYQAELKKPGFPRLSNRFHCQSILYEQIKAWGSAGWASLRAAWVCDDAKNEKGSREFRIQAAKFFQKAIENGEGFTSDLGKQYRVLVDVLRRTNRLKMALALCKTGIQELEGTTDKVILEFEQELILAGDTLPYSVGKVEIPTFDVHHSSIDDRVLAKRVGLFPKLKALKLNGSQITDDGLAVLQNMPCLEFLDVSHVGISDKGLEYIKGLASLRELYITHTKVTSTGIEALKKALPKLVIHFWIDSRYE